MLKYLVVLVIVLGGAFVVARQDQHAADQAAQKAAQFHKAAVPAKPDEQHPQENIENSTGDGPGWYKDIFRWPSGTPVWAIILTLLAIAEQTSQTRKAAQASKVSADATRVQAEISRKAFVSQFRPKVPVRAMWLMENGGALKVEIWLTNIGDTPAHITRSDIKVAWEVPAELKRGSSPPAHSSRFPCSRARITLP